MRRWAWLVALLLFSGCQAALGEQSVAVDIAPAYPVYPHIQRLLDVAGEEIGYAEASDGTTKYGVWAGDPKAQWCAEYLCWSVYQTDERYATGMLTVQYPLYGASNTGRDWFIAQGRYIARNGFVTGWGSQWYRGENRTMPKNSYIPQPGDWVFLSYDASGDTAHVAMVEKCLRQPDGSVIIQVIEGNNPVAVARALYPLTDWRIQGYGTVRDLADIVLRMGAQGEKVRALQALLVEVELLQIGDISGVYSQRTSDAVKRHQASMGVSQTGIANRATQLSLGEHLVAWRAGRVGYFTVEEGL